MTSLSDIREPAELIKFYKQILMSVGDLSSEYKLSLKMALFFKMRLDCVSQTAWSPQMEGSLSVGLTIT